MDKVQQTFTEVFQEQRWGSGESVSGTGSSLKATVELIPQLLSLVAEKSIGSFVDAPCGDFNWIGPVARAVDSYTGLDIVEEVVRRASERAAHDGVERANFSVANIISDDLPAADLFLVRDCIVHLAFDQGLVALANVRAKSKWLLTTTFPDLADNRDVKTGQWRPLNLQLAPFNFSPPIQLIVERPSIPPHEKWGRKCLGLWARV